MLQTSRPALFSLGAQGATGVFRSAGRRLASTPSRRLRPTRNCGTTPCVHMRLGRCVLSFLFRLWRFPWGYYVGRTRRLTPHGLPPRISISIEGRECYLKENYKKDEYLSRSQRLFPAVPSRVGLRAGERPPTLLIRARRSSRTSQLISTRQGVSPGDLGLRPRYNLPEMKNKIYLSASWLVRFTTVQPTHKARSNDVAHKISHPPTSLAAPGRACRRGRPHRST